MHVPRTTSPATIRHLPSALRGAYEHAFAVALHPVFLTATAIAALAFVLTWFLHDVPLRTQTRPGDAFPPPRDERAAVEAAAR